MMIIARHRQLFLICVLLGSVILTVSCENNPAAASAAPLPDVIKIGFLTPLTGALGAYGPGMQEGAELAQWVINTKRGGILRPGLSNATLDLLVRDTATDPSTTVTVVTDLITTDGVEIIVGAAGSTNTLAAAGVTNPTQVVLLSYASTSPNITTQGGEYTFRVAVSDAFQGWALADLALGRGYREAASLFQDNLWGHGVAAGFKEQFEVLGGTVVDEIAYDPAASSFIVELNEIKALQDAGSIDVIMDTSWVDDGAIIFPEAASLGITTPWVCSEGVADPAIFGTAGVGAAMKGMWGTTPFTNTSTPEYQQFLSYFNVKYPAETPELYADYAYDAVMLAVDAIIAANTYEGTALKDALQNISQGWQGATGDKSFNTNGDVWGDYRFWNVTEPTADNYEFTTQGYWTPDITPPDLDTPPNIQYDEGSTGNNITWQPADAHPADYTLYRNDTINASGVWRGGALTFAIDGLSQGLYNYTLLVNDTFANWAASTVWVTVIDVTPPTVDQPPPDVTYNEGTTGNTITWQLIDAHPANYILYRNGTIHDSGVWDGGALTFGIDGLAVGIYNYTLLINDTAGNWATSTVWVTAKDATLPTIDQPLDITYELGTLGHTITWQPSDSYPYWYNITRDGFLVAEDGWDGSAIRIDIDGLAVGVYTYTLVVYDQHGNSASDSVVVTVTEVTDGKEPSVGSPGFTISVLLLLGIVFSIERKWARRKKNKL